MMDYSIYSDQDLILSVRSGDRHAEEELLKRYSQKVRICARRFYLLGGDDEDLLQEGMIGLLNAVRSFNPALGTSFNTYAEKCIKSRLIDASQFKGYVEFISSEDYVLEDSADEESNPETLLIKYERYEELVSQLRLKLSQFETSVLNLYLNGYSYPEIAAMLGKPDRSIYNAVQRIRGKLSELL